jgi:hypothetical protein
MVRRESAIRVHQGAYESPANEALVLPAAEFDEQAVHDAAF